jgi:predicted Zn-dependent protease
MTMTTWKRVYLVAAAAVIALAVGGGGTAAFLEAEAGPRHRLGAPAKKKSKKELAIERHMFTAQYYLLRENNSKAAVRELNKVLRLDRNHLEASIGLAEIHIRDKKPERAIKLLEKLSRKRNAEAQVWQALGRAALADGKEDKALAAYGKAVAIQPRDREGLWLIFDLTNRRYRAKRAEVESLRQAGLAYVRASPERSGYRYEIVERTMVEISGDNMALVVYDANRAYEAAFTERQFGRINARMRDARRGYERCLTEQPKNQRCHYGLGLVFASVKASEHYDRDKARGHFAKADKLPEAHYEIARLARLADDLPAARKALARALKLRSDYQQALLELGIVHKLDGNDKKAVADLARAYHVNRFTAAAETAVAELAKIDPGHDLVKQGMLYGNFAGDVFSTDRFKAAISLVEQSHGGVDESAPEKKVLEKVLSRLLEAADADSAMQIKVAVLNTKMVNAMAMPNGNIYFTRGFLDHLKKAWPKRPVDADNDVLGHIMGHELAHVMRKHTLNSMLFRQAVKDAERHLDGMVLTHITRIQEIEADRVGMVWASLAGYHPRGGIDFMEDRGKESEIPTHLDHPTYEERVRYLEEYWSNDVKYAYLSFQLGLRAMEAGDRLRASDPTKAGTQYTAAIDHLTRFHTTLKPTKQVLNNLGSAYAKLGVLALAGKQSPLHLWQTRFSLEKESALKYRAVVRGGGTRGGAKVKVPKELTRAMALFRDALKRDPSYDRARANLATTYLAVGEIKKASSELGRVRARGFEAGQLALLRGIVWSEQGNYRNGGTAFRQAMKHKPTHQAASYNMARLYQLAKKKKEARGAYKGYLKRYPRGPWAAAARKALKTL